MTSTHTMLALIGIYAVIGSQSAYERNWYRSLYYVGAIVISVAVLGMTAQRERGA